MIADVAQFMAAVGHVEVNPTLANLYWNLVNEEHGELMHARMTANRVEEVDAICDSIWVLIGYGLAKGYDMPAAWAEVARSNLAKINPETGMVRKREDGKVIKPDGWSPPKLEQCV